MAHSFPPADWVGRSFALAGEPFSFVATDSPALENHLRAWARVVGVTLELESVGDALIGRVDTQPAARQPVVASPWARFLGWFGLS